MQKYRFSNPTTVVEVVSRLTDNTIFDCLCRLYGYHKRGPRKTYTITATSGASAARQANELYRKEFAEQLKLKDNGKDRFIKN